MALLVRPESLTVRAMSRQFQKTFEASIQSSGLPAVVPSSLATDLSLLEPQSVLESCLLFSYQQSLFKANLLCKTVLTIYL